MAALASHRAGSLSALKKDVFMNPTLRRGRWWPQWPIPDDFGHALPVQRSTVYFTLNLARYAVGETPNRLSNARAKTSSLE